jgi:hypothetical protein
VSQRDNTPTIPDDTKERIRELRALSDRAEDGDKEARRELRAAVRSSAPEVIARVSNIASTYRGVLAQTASGGDELTYQGLNAYMMRMEETLAGDNPTPLEALLAERVVSCWMLVELMEALLAGWFNRQTTKENRVSPPFLLQMVKIQESANRRYLAAIKTLAQVRRLQSNTPGVQYNTQINVVPGGGRSGGMKGAAAEKRSAPSGEGGGGSRR